MRYSNNSNLPLSLSVWLATDTYDHDQRTHYISATSLLKPVRQLVLSNRVDPTDNTPDVLGQLASSTGTAIHDSIEHAWLNHYQEGLAKLGYPQKVIDRVKVNPSKDELTDDTIPIYLEQRSEKEINGFVIGGKFDFVGDGRLEDFKTTSVYTYMHKTKDDDYIQQGSIYRWLNPDIVTRDDMAIQFIFTDWSPTRVKENNYPPAKTHEYKLQLQSLQETERFLINKTNEIKQYWYADEKDLPLCNDKDLWRKPTVYKVYKDENAKRAMSGGVFEEDLLQAQIFARKAPQSVIKTFPGEVVACRYCDAFPICTQKDKYIQSGELKLGL